MKKLTKWSVLAAGLLAIAMGTLAGCASITSAQVSTPPAKTVYRQGQELDITGLTVETTDSKGKVKMETITSASNVSGYDPNKVGTQTLSASVGFWGNVTATFEVRVVPLESVTVTTPPAKTRYKQGEDIDTAGLVVRGAWAELGEDDIPASNYTLSGYDKDTAGDQTVTVTAEGKTAGFTVSVVPLTSVAIAAKPAKTQYIQGEDFDAAGLVVRGAWTGMGEGELPADGFTLSGYDKGKAGTQTITVTAGGKTATFTVSVTAPPPLEGYWTSGGGSGINFKGNTFETISESGPTAYSGNFVFDEAKRAITFTITTHRTMDAEGNIINGPVTGAVVTCTATLNADKTELVLGNPKAGPGAGAAIATSAITWLTGTFGH